jgi:arylsulfatase A-like enzyme
MAAQLRLGTRVLFWTGLLAGGGLGVWVVSLENAHLLFADGWTKARAVVLLASGTSVAAVVLFLPVEAALAWASRRWPAVARASHGRLYVSAFVIGGLLLHALLWVHFEVVRDSTSPRALALSCSLALAAAAVLAGVSRVPGRRIAPARAVAGTTFRLRESVLPILPLALSLAVGVWAYRDLSATLRAAEVPSDGGTTGAPPVMRARRAAPTASVILISIDTLRPDHLSGYGYSRPTSPNLDRLARDGVIFRHARTHSPWTLPAHATMLTSRHPISHGARRSSNSRFVNTQAADTLAAWNVTLAEMLQAAGMHTAAFTTGEWLSRAFGFAQGFDAFELHARAPAARLIDRSIDWIGRNRDRFFLFLHVLDVHEYASPGAYEQRYADPGYAGPLREQPLTPSMNAYERLSAADVAYLEAKYDAAVSYTDAELGRLFGWLADTRRYDDTLVIVTADHGEEFWEHGGTGHGFTLHEEQLRVPLIVKPPAGEPGGGPQIREEPSGLLDVVPTVLDYLDMPACGDCEGQSLRTPTASDRPFFAGETYFGNSAAVIRRGYKYIENRIPPSNPLELGFLFDTVRTFYKFRASQLYRLESDPAEQQDILAGARDLAAAMRLELLAHVRSPRRGARLVLDDELRRKLRSLGYVH